MNRLIEDYQKWKEENPDKDYQRDEIHDFLNCQDRSDLFSLMEEAERTVWPPKDMINGEGILGYTDRKESDRVLGLLRDCWSICWGTKFNNVYSMKESQEAFWKFLDDKGIKYDKR
jgi:hypothetical protein